MSDACSDHIKGRVVGVAVGLGHVEDVDLALDSLADAGEDGAYALGEIARGEGGIELC